MRTLVVGRHSSSGGVDIAIAPTEDTVGRRHAEITVNDDGTYFLRDLGSANGTFIHDGARWNRVTSSRVSPQQQIRLGDYITSISQLLPSVGERQPVEAGYEPTPQLRQPAQVGALPVYQAQTYDPHAGGYVPHSRSPAVNEPLAVWSFVLSLVGLLCCGGLTAIPAVICGHVAVSRIGNPPRKRGKGFAIAGLVLGYIGVLWFLLVLVYIVFLGGLAAIMGLAAMDL
jgi:hypothetical protein